MEGLYNPPLSEFVGGMTDELGGSYITEYVSNGPKKYAYRTGDGKQVVKVKGFTLNYVASQQLTFDVMKEMSISEQEEHIIVTESRKIRKDLKRRQINTLPSSSCIRVFSTRECATLTTTPVYRTDMRNHYIYILVAVRLESNLVCVCMCGSYLYFALPFNLLHFTCDIIYYYLPFIYFNCIYFSSHVYGCSWYLRYYK